MAASGAGSWQTDKGTARKSPTRTRVKHHAPLTFRRPRRSFLAWPAWLRVLAAPPVLALLWLGVLWARMEAEPW